MLFSHFLPSRTIPATSTQPTYPVSRTRSVTFTCLIMGETSSLVRDGEGGQATFGDERSKQPIAVRLRSTTHQLDRDDVSNSRDVPPPRAVVVKNFQYGIAGQRKEDNVCLRKSEREENAIISSQRLVGTSAIASLPPYVITFLVHYVPVLRNGAPLTNQELQPFFLLS